MRWGISVLAGVVIVAGCIAPPTQSSTLRGSGDDPPEPKIVQTIASQPPNSDPVPVTLTADGHFTAEGIRRSFLTECAEAALKSGYDSFALFHYTMNEPQPHHYEAHGEIVEAKGRFDDPGKDIFDARKVLANPAR
jgi:hypothetical protein